MLMNVDLIIDKKTGRQFHQNTTFRHRDDGDNTIGWIEEITGAADSDGGVENEGQVVAEIGDSEIYNCIVKP